MARCELHIYSHAFIVLAWTYAKVLPQYCSGWFFSLPFWVMLEMALFLSFDCWTKICCHVSCNSGNLFPYHNTDKAVSLFPCSKNTTRHQIQQEISERDEFDKKITPPKAKKGNVENDCESGSPLNTRLKSTMLPKNDCGTHHHMNLRKR